MRTDLLEADRSEGDAYFAVASFSSNASRTIDNVFKLRALRLDIDYGEHHRSKAVYATRLEALAAIERFRDAVGLPEPMIVESGGGLHCYWPLKEPLPLAQWLRYSEGLKAACHRFELRADHGLTANAAGVLRLPGTTNAETGHAGPEISRYRAVRPRAVRGSARVRAATEDRPGPVSPAAAAPPPDRLQGPAGGVLRP